MRRLAQLAVLFVALPAIMFSQNTSRVRAEVRTDAIFARVNHAHAGVGVAVRTAYNVRAHVAAGGGVAFKNGDREASVRGDATLRLLLDPFGEAATGLSIGGGVGVFYDGFEMTRPVGILVLGLEGAARKPVVWALEIGLGGGARVGLVLKPRASRYR